MKLRIAESSYIVEDIEAVKKYYPNIDDETFMSLIQLDPTYRNNNSLGKYGKWILNLYNKGAISEDDFSEITPLLNQFTTYRNRVQNKDLNSYKSISDLESILAQVVDDDSMLTDRQKVRFLKNVKAGRVKTNAENDYDKVYEDSDWVVYVPNTHEASMKLGKGTEWCTAHENPDWYEKYTNEDGEEFSLYIMKNKHTGERYQYCDNYMEGCPFMDQTDTSVDLITFMEDLRNDGNYEFEEWLINLNDEKFRVPIERDGMFISEDTNFVTGVADYFEPKLEVPDGVTGIDYSAFEGQSDLEEISFPSTLRVICSYAFADCDNLINIDFSNVQKLSRIESKAFYQCVSINYLYIENVDSIHEEAFYDCDNLTRLTIENVSEIRQNAFARCSELKYVDLGGDSNAPLSIWDGAFRLCYSLETLILPETVKDISDTAFSGCDFEILTIYSDSEYVQKYCEENGIKWEER